jgi:hypothetical protein
MSSFTIPASDLAVARRRGVTHDEDGDRITDRQLAVLILNAKLGRSTWGMPLFMQLLDQGRITVRETLSGDYEVSVPEDVL